MLIAKYTANASGVVPTFNDGYVYEVIETENGGIYTVEINSDNDFTSCSFAGINNLLTVEYLKITSNVTSMYSMFNGCNALTSLDVSNFDTTNVTKMNAMFEGCNALTSLDLSSFDTKNVTNMGYMFKNCSTLTSLDLSNFDTSSVTHMPYMFDNCNTLKSLNVSGFDTSKVTNMNHMFQNCNALTSLDLNNFNTPSVTNMTGMFNGCNALTSLDVSNFDTSNVTEMANMFYNCQALTSLDVSGFDTSKVTSMYGMFNGCKALTSLDVSNFDTSSVTSMDYMFNICNTLTTLDLSNFDTKNVKSMYSMFSACIKLTSLDLSNFDTTNVTGMAYMFNNCNALTSLDVSGFDTSSVTSMHYMFQNCNALTSLDLNNFNTQSVTNMHYMFKGCSELTSLDLSNFNTSNVTRTDYMLHDCNKLDVIGLIYSDIDTINALPIPSKATLYIDKNIDQTLYTGSSILKIYEIRSITINLPTALRSEGEIADRLYWDETDKHYYIEQWIDPNTEEILEEPNIIASGIVNPIEIHQYEKQFSVDLQNISPSYMAITVPYFDIPDDYEYNEADEVEYFKQSFELRFPDEDDYDPWYGFLGVNTGTMVTDYTRVSNGFATTFWSYDDTTLNFSSDTTVVSVECYMDNELITSMPINTTEGSSVIISGTNKIRIVFASIPKAFYIDDKKYIFGEALSKEIDKDPYLGQEIDSSRGIKRLVDWVDGCSDKEFVEKFDDYFHRDYTLRYYLLVITLG